MCMEGSMQQSRAYTPDAVKQSQSAHHTSLGGRRTCMREINTSVG